MSVGKLRGILSYDNGSWFGWKAVGFAKESHDFDIKSMTSRYFLWLHENEFVLHKSTHGFHLDFAGYFQPEYKIMV